MPQGHVFNTVREISRELDELDASAVELVRKRRLAMHYEKLEKRRANELSEAKRKGMHLRYGMMLKPWVGVHPGKAGDFVWCLEALAYRIKQTGAGTLSEDRPFTRFDPEDD